MNYNEFNRGADFISINIGAPIGQYVSNDGYWEKISLEIEKLTKAINENTRKNNPIPSLAGFLAESWHAGTYNINAIIKGTTEMASVPDVNSTASVDVKIGGGMNIQLKYYKNPHLTAKAILMTYEEYYRKHSSGVETFEEFFRKKGIDIDESYKHKSIYSGQLRLVPADQYESIIKDIKKTILIEKTRRPELVQNYEETLNNMIDRIKGEGGTESIPLTKEEAETLAKAAKEGLFKPEEYGLTLNEMVDNRIVMDRAIKAGVNAALIAALLKVVPLLISAIKNADTIESFDWYDFSQKGLEVFTSGGKSFVIGAFTSAINDMCKKKCIALNEFTPEAIGTLVALIITITEEFIKVSLGKSEYDVCISNCIQSSVIALFGCAGSVLLSSIPAGIIIGNILGCIIGGFAYSVTNKIFLSFCAESGFSCFGLVEQDYSLPACVLEDMGLDLIKFDECELDECEFDECELDMIEFDECEFDTAMPYVIKRGVIGVNRIGYVIV